MKILMWSLVSLAAAGAIIGSLFLLGPLGQDRTGTGTPRENPEASSGKQVYNLEVDGVSREFIVYRPETLEADAEVPVVFMFHGSGQSGEMFYQESGWVDKADEEGLMVVFPTALKYHVFSDEKIVNGKLQTDVAAYQTKWNSYELAGLFDPEFPPQTAADDLAFTDSMLAFLDENYAVDNDRIYATGFSNGAQFTVRLAVERSDVFAAFAPTSGGRIPDEVIAKIEASSQKPGLRPVVQVIGANDAKANYASGVDVFTTDESAANDGNPIKDNYIANYLVLEQLEDEYVYEEVMNSAHFTYSESTVGANNEYQLYVAEKMGHIYPNGNNFRVDITDIFWPFFEQYSL
jgi:poly(3-hydroxybutyrate) depolymerase